MLIFVFCFFFLDKHQAIVFISLFQTSSYISVGDAFQGRDEVCLGVCRSGKGISKQVVLEDLSYMRSWMELAA